MTPVEKLLAKIIEPKPTPKGGWTAKCPAHDDGRASLSISEGDDGRVLVHCHAGCTIESICDVLGMKLSDLMPPVPSTGKTGALSPTAKPATPKRKLVATYDYKDEFGNLVYQVVRYDPKEFLQRKPKSSGGWDWSVKGVRAVPYRLPDLKADEIVPVFVVEGEKDVDNLKRIGIVATCNSGGGGKWTAEHAQFLRNRDVIVTGDNDETGKNHVVQVASSLQGTARSVKVIELPNLPPKGDVSDWILAGGTKSALMQIVDAASIWTVNTVKPWPDIIAFDTAELPAFPTEVLPDEIRRWVEAESIATQTPADLAALLVLAVCGAAIARKIEVEPRSGWREPVNLFVAILLEPGNRKSAVFGDVLKPLREIEAELIETSRPSISRQQSNRRQAEMKLKKLEKISVEKDDANARHEAGNLAAELAEQIEPVLPRLIVDDATSEKLGTMLADQGGRIASMSPEGGVFDLMAGLYSKSGIPQFGVYLMGHSGDDLITDRISRPSVHVQKPALTCAYAMQPQVIEGLAENTAFRGRGLLARFLYAAPTSWIGSRKIAPPPVSEELKQNYRRAVRDLFSVDGEHVLPLDEKAKPAMESWEAEIELMLGDGGEMEITKDWGAKLAGETLRIAAILHCLLHGPVGRITEQTVEAAIKIARYLIPHSEAVLNMMKAKDDDSDGDAQYVLKWIKRHDRREFTKRDAHQHGKRRFPKVNDLDGALNELSKRGYIRLRPIASGGPGRPTSPTYDVNPALFNASKSNERSHNSQNPPGGVERGSSENIGNGFAPAEMSDRIQVTI